MKTNNNDNQFFMYSTAARLTDNSIEIDTTLVLNSDFLKDCTSKRSKFGRRYYYDGEYLVYYLCDRAELGEIIYLSLRSDKQSGRKIALVNSFPDAGFQLRIS